MRILEKLRLILVSMNAKDRRCRGLVPIVNGLLGVAVVASVLPLMDMCFAFKISR